MIFSQEIPECVCVHGREGEIGAGCGPACTVKLERMPGDQLLGDLKSSLCWRK